VQTASLTTVRAYEAVGLLLFLGGWLFVWRRRNPLYVGFYLATSIGAAVFEWIYDSKYYFRLTAAKDFIPAWTMDGVQAPLAMIFFYAFAIGVPLMIALDRRELLVKRFGRRGIYVFLVVMAVVGTLAFESTNTSLAHIYAYHQRRQYLIWGMPWSNLWFGPLIWVFSYWGMSAARSLAVGQDRTIKVALGFWAVIAGFFVASVINGVWYVLSEPWTHTPRPF
jgi:hypothetical protein